MTPSQTKGTVLKKTEQNKLHNQQETLENYTTNMHIYEGLSMNNLKECCHVEIDSNGKTVVKKIDE